MAELYKIALQEAWRGQTAHLLDDRKQLQKQIRELEDKLSYIRDLLSSKQIEPEDFREMKSDYSSKVEKLQAKLNGLSYNDINLKALLDKRIDNLLKLDYIYETADIDKKREVISSIFPEKLHFENSSLRTGRVNEAVKYITRPSLSQTLFSHRYGHAQSGKNWHAYSVKISVALLYGYPPITSLFVKLPVSEI